MTSQIFPDTVFFHLMLINSHCLGLRDLNVIKKHYFSRHEFIQEKLFWNALKMQNQVQENNFFGQTRRFSRSRKTGKFSLKFTKTHVLTRPRDTKFAKTQNQFQEFPANLINLSQNLSGNGPASVLISCNWNFKLFLQGINTGSHQRTTHYCLHTFWRRKFSNARRENICSCKKN